MAPRILLLGPVNTVHFEHQALAVAEHGVEVVAAGQLWPGPPSGLAGTGIPVEVTDGSLVPWLWRVLRRVRPDVVHAHWLPFAAKALVARARPLVAQPWGSDVYRATPAFRAANVPVARFADRIVADSADLAAAMVRLGARPDRTHVVNWGVDFRTFNPPDVPRAQVRARLGLDEGPMVLSPRSLKPLYNPATVLAAFEALADRVPDAQLVVKHMGADVPAELRPLPPRVHVVGHVAYERMADWYRAADVCVSIPDTDSSPRSVWEAMACGTPCVVSDLPWAREDIRPGEEALVVPAEPVAVAAALATLLEEPHIAARIGAAGRRLVERTRDRDVETGRLVGLYRELAAR